MNTKNLLLFYKQKIVLLENQNSFLLNQTNFLEHQNDQRNKIRPNLKTCWFAINRPGIEKMWDQKNILMHIF